MDLTWDVNVYPINSFWTDMNMNNIVIFLRRLKDDYVPVSTGYLICNNYCDFNSGWLTYEFFIFL